MTKRICPGCGKHYSGPPRKKYCTPSCGQRHYQRLKRRGAQQGVATIDGDAILRVTGDNFFLAALDEELDLLGRSKNAARAALEATLRQAISTGPEWPHSVAGRCALILWLLDHPTTERGRFHHLFETVKRPGQAVKPTGTLIHAGLGRIGSGL